MNPSINGRHSAAVSAPAQSCSTGQVPVPARFMMPGTTTVYSTAMPAPASKLQCRAAHHVGEKPFHAAQYHQRRGAFADDLVRDESAPQQLRLFVQQPEEVGHAPFAEYPHRIPVADYARAFFCE
jgi:hypothetical protein